MPLSFHLTVSRAAVHAGETSRRAKNRPTLRIRQRAKPMSAGANKPMSAVATKPQILLPPSPQEEPELLATPPPTAEVSTPRPTLDLAAPKANRSMATAPGDMDYDAFGGESPGFCPTGACRCGRCGDGGSRYTYDDYARDYDGYGEEDNYYDNGYVVSAYVHPIETYTEAKTRICSVLSRYITAIGGLSGNASKELLLLEMTQFLLDDPFTQEFLDRNPRFKDVLGTKMTECGLDAERLDVRTACGAVIGRFF